MKRKNIVAGNWKMNKSYQEGLALTQELITIADPGETLVVLGTPYIHLHDVAILLARKEQFKLAAQNCHQAEKGAYTGEISIDMLKSVGVDYVILGHSERREYFKEDNALLAQKVDLVLDRGLLPIFCCGESLAIRESGDHVNYVSNQIRESLFHLDADAFSKIVIAYEPIWAIGTGVTASPEQAQDMHREIRALLRDQYGADIADACSILYGGSVKPANAQSLFGQADVDGGLVGGASLKAADFSAIIDAFK